MNSKLIVSILHYSYINFTGIIKMWYVVDVCINRGKVAYFSFCTNISVRGIMEHHLEVLFVTALRTYTKDSPKLPILNSVHARRLG